MRPVRGFTLTELMIVVAVLAILAAAAVPRFFAINRQIRTGAVEALAVNVRSAAKLTNRIWQSNGRPARLMVDGRALDMRFGFPTETSIDDVVAMSGDFRFADGYWKHRDTASTPGCAVLYVPPPNPEAEPVIISYTDGC